MLKMKTAAVGVSFHPFLEGNVGTQTTMLLVRGFACLLVALFFFFSFSSYSMGRLGVANFLQSAKHAD